MTLCKFPETWADIILDLRPRVAGGDPAQGLQLVVVDKDGKPKDFGAILDFRDSGGHAEIKRMFTNPASFGFLADDVDANRVKIQD